VTSLSRLCRNYADKNVVVCRRLSASFASEKSATGSLPRAYSNARRDMLKSIMPLLITGAKVIFARQERRSAPSSTCRRVSLGPRWNNSQLVESERWFQMRQTRRRRRTNEARKLINASPCSLASPLCLYWSRVELCFGASKHRYLYSCMSIKILINTIMQY